MENKTKYQEYMKIFLEENSKVNLISKNDEKYGKSMFSIPSQ